MAPSAGIGEFLRAARVSQGMTLRELGVAVGLSAPTLSRYERGRLVPTWAAMKAIAHALGVSVRTARAWLR